MMLYGWRGWMLLGAFSPVEAFLSGPLLPVMRTAGAHLSRCRETTRRAKIIMQEASPIAEASSISQAGIEIEDVSGKRLLLEFAAFGFYNRTCQLELIPNGDCVFSRGMVTREKGAWRVEEEEGKDYLQFSAPLTELYSEIFDVPSSLLFWRVPLSKAGDGTIVLTGGQIISERKTLLGLKTNFIDEGSFKARVLANDEKFPEPDFDLRSVEVPDGLKVPKKKSKEDQNLVQDVAEPPLPSDMG